MLPTIKSALRGCYELPLFLKQGVGRFQNSSRSFWQSTLVPLFLIPLQLPLAGADPEMARYPLVTLIVAQSYLTVISTAFFLGGVWLLTWPLERKDKFYQFGAAANWLSLTSYVLLLPYFLLVLSGTFSAAQLGNFLFFMICFFMAVIAFTAKNSLNIHWVVAVLIGIGALLAEIIAATLIGVLHASPPDSGL